MINVDKLNEYNLKDFELKEKVFKESKRRVMRLGQFLEYKLMYPLAHEYRKFVKCIIYHS